MWGDRPSFGNSMKRIQCSVTYPEQLLHPLHQKLMETESVTRAELLMWSPTEDATTLLWCDSDQAAAKRVIETIDSLLVSNLVEDIDGTYAFLQQDDYEFSAVLLDMITESQVIFLPPVVFLDTGDVQFEAVGETAALNAFHDELSEIGELTIEQVQEFERKNSPSRLTDRQQAALDAAVSVGYYTVPREGTIADIAAVLDCSTSTAGELIRKAEAAVVQNHVEMR